MEHISERAQYSEIPIIANFIHKTIFPLLMYVMKESDDIFIYKIKWNVTGN